MQTRRVFISRLALLVALAGALLPVFSHAGGPPNEPPKKEGRDKRYLFRLQAAKLISEEATRANVLVDLAKDAAGLALAGVVEQCIAALPEGRKVAAIAEMAPLLADSGREAAALKMAESIADAKARDNVLVALARGPSSEMTPLMRAAFTGNTEVVLDLLDNKANVNEGSVKLVRVSNRFAYGTIKDHLQQGATPLMLAAANGHAAAVKALLDRGADVNSKTEPSQFTALILASMHGRKQVVDALLHKGADVHAKSVSIIGDTRNTVLKRYSAFEWAVQHNHPDIVAVLLDKGVSTNEGLAFAKLYRRDIAQLIESRVPKKQLTPEEALQEALKKSLKEDRDKLRGLWEAPGRLFLLGEGGSGTSVIVTALDEKGAIDKVGAYVWGAFEEKKGKRFFKLSHETQPLIEVEYRWKGDNLELVGGVVLEGGRVVGLTGEWRRSPKK